MKESRNPVKTASRRKLRLAVVVFICLFGLFLLPSCGMLSEEEAIARLGELLPRSLAVEEAVWGEGLPSDGSVAYDPKKDGAQYAPVRGDAAFSSVAALLAELAQVYTVERAEEIVQVALIGVGEEDPRYAEENGVFCVDLAYQGISLGGDLNLSQARMTDSNPYMIQIAVPVRYADGSEGEKSVRLANVEGVWLLDSPTYYQDRE